MAKTKLVISARDFLPKRRSISALRMASKTCRGCHLYKNASQTVFGQGSPKANIMVVGEIPGEKEDELGKPFVGPAGVFLRKMIEEAHLDVEDIYFTNVVKHFKFSYFNNRKMHRSPSALEIAACIPWLEMEIKLIQPRIILCLGSTAAKALISKRIQITKQRGKWFDLPKNNIRLLVTFHPSAILRANSDEERHRMKRLFLKDLKKISLLS